jgi:hypothetical protein
MRSWFVMGGNMKKVLLRVLPLVIVFAYLTPVRSASVDPVIYWNGVAAAAFTAATSPAPAGTPAPIPPVRPGQVGGLDFAMVQVAVHDAVQAFERRFQPYGGEIAGATGSPAAAVAAAAHDVLVNIYGSYSWVVSDVNAKYGQYLSSNSLTGDAGIFVGQHAATNIINMRMNDGRFAAFPAFTGGTAPGEWRPTESFNLPLGASPPTPPGPPPSFAPMAVVWLGFVRPFTLTSPQQFRADGPPALTSPEYKRAYDEVKALGSLTSTARTAEQTDLGYFYADNFILLWNRAISAIAAQHTHNLGDAARLFALVYLAEADSGITAWDSKRHFNFWRPLTAIREGNNDTNPLTSGDPNWKPLINTPNYPDYTSGANNVTGSVTKMLALFFHREAMTFTLHSNYPLAVQKDRTYKHFSDAARDVVNVRIYQGIHFRFADVDARHQGRQVAEWAYKHFLRPIHDDDDSDADDQDDDRDR